MLLQKKSGILRETETETETETERQTDRERQRDRQTDRQTDRQSNLQQLRRLYMELEDIVEYSILRKTF